MTRTITTIAELDALPVKVVLLDEGGWPVWRDPHTGWCASNGTRDIPADLLIADGAPLTILHDPSDPAPAPSVVSDAAGLGDRIAALSARLAAVGFPACTCHPGDDDSERCLPSPQDWRAEIERAALSSTTLTAAPSATREEVARLVDPSGWRYFDTGMFPPDHPASTGVVHNSRETADALLARFNNTPKEDR